MGLVTLYLVAIVAANLIVARFGPSASVVTAFVLIAFNLVSRDALHDRWQTNRVVRMALLIAAGSVISWWLNAGRIAAASSGAFALSEACDFVVYHRLRKQRWAVRSNSSNAVGALVDSIVFPTLAFGAWLPWVVVGQFAAKTLGGVLWSWLLGRGRKLTTVAAVLLVGIAGTAQAQIVSVNGAWMHNSAVSDPVAEVFVASPPVSGVRAFTILSWNLAAAEPTYIARIGYGTRVKGWTVGAGAGVIGLKFLDYRPKPSLGGRISAPAVRGLNFYAVSAYEKTPAWGWTTFIGVSRTLYFRQ